jgi:exopolysaccharide biosynthesis polyprenyl glycosylphosphotransferase
MITRRFFWLSDSFSLVAAFLIAYAFAPILRSILSTSSGVPRAWVAQYLNPSVPIQPFPPISEFAWILLSTGPSTILIIGLLGGYRRKSLTLLRTGLSGATAPLLSLGLVALGLLAIKENSWSRLFFFLYGGTAAMLVIFFRLVLLMWWRQRCATGIYARNVVVIGAKSNCKRLTELFQQRSVVLEYRLFGYMTTQTDEKPLHAPEMLYLGNVNQLGDLAVHQPIHEVIFIVGSNDEVYLKGVVETCDYFRLYLRITPEIFLNCTTKDLKHAESGGLFNLPAITLRPREADSDMLFVKRLIDIIISFFLLVLLSPLFIAIAIAIKVTSPRLNILYPWRVVGKNGLEFVGYKFTTMVANADDLKESLAALNEMTGPVFKIQNDPRVTSLGKFLRKFSFNELPQLWSVLIGDMSLVGPRPAGRHELVRYELWHKRKLSIQPGISCLWQVRGRNKITNFDDWVRMDLEYIDNWSLWLDIKIIFRTAWVVARGSGS